MCVFFFFAETKEDVWTSAASRFFMDRLPQPVFSPVDVRACVPIRHVRLSAFFFFMSFFPSVASDDIMKLRKKRD